MRNFCIAYFSYISTDLKTAIDEITSPNESENLQKVKEAEAVAMFYLEVLSAFKPSKIAFEILLHVNPASAELSRICPQVQLGLMWLIYVHCSV